MPTVTRNVLVFWVFSWCFAVPVQPANGCGYDACNLGDRSKLNVHLVPHSHDDVGWLKTVDEYYYGARNGVHQAGIQYILDSVVVALDENAERRFIYVEMAYFWRGWNQQAEDTRAKVRQFVNEGRLEFISGGWCMNDEATTHYSAIIDQHSLGAEFLREEFGDCARPKVGWQIDPFGHSREQASILAQMGFDGLFFGRADYEDFLTRKKDRTLEMVWKASANLDHQSWLFTGILSHGYAAPDSFCFDSKCTDEPIQDNPHLFDYNVDERVQAFIEAAHNQSVRFTTNHIMMTFGSDFQYEVALENFKNLDKLIKYVNAQQSNGSDVNVFYSTPSCYLYALNRADRAWRWKSDDFLPLASHPNGFWTGFYTSRPALKRYERYANNLLQMTKQLNALARTNLRNTTFLLSEAMGIVQHHDAISGTEKQRVAFDYAQRLSDGIRAAENVINQAYAKLQAKTNSSALRHFLCPLLNISECLEIEEQERFTLTLWNPTVHPVVHYPRVPVTRDYTVRDSTGQIISSDFLPVSNRTRNLPGRNSTATHQLIFQANLPALGFRTYFLEMKKLADALEVKRTPNQGCVLQNQYLRVEVDEQGNLHRIVNQNQSIFLPFTSHGFYWYEGYPGNNTRLIFQASGAYIFRPFHADPQPVSTQRTVSCLQATNVQTAVIVFNDWASEEISVYQDSELVEIEWTIGPIPVEDQIGKEVILRYETNISSQAKFYTDSNGREVLERIRDYRPTWNYTPTETVSGNYYPINSRIWIRDGDRQLTILTDRTQGGGSIRDGSMELMVHRRLVYDDNLGVRELLNETAFDKGLVVRGKHFLSLERLDSSAFRHRVAAQNLYMQPVATFAVIEQTYENFSSNYQQIWSALNETLPLNVHLLTLDQLDGKTYLIRLEHYFELYEDQTYSQPVSIDLQSIFRTIGTINRTVELTLGANLPLADLQRLVWLTGEDELSEIEVEGQRLLNDDDDNIILNPMQIRTFRVIIN